MAASQSPAQSLGASRHRRSLCHYPREVGLIEVTHGRTRVRAWPREFSPPR